MQLAVDIEDLNTEQLLQYTRGTLRNVLGNLRVLFSTCCTLMDITKVRYAYVGARVINVYVNLCVCVQREC